MSRCLDSDSFHFIVIVMHVSDLSWIPMSQSTAGQDNDSNKSMTESGSGFNSSGTRAESVQVNSS